MEYVILLLYLNSLDLYQAENQVSKPPSLFVILHCGVGKNWAGPFFPPSKMLESFYLSSRLLDYVILLLYLNSLDLHQAENQVFKPTSLFVILHCGVGKNWAGPLFPPSKMLGSFYLSSRRLDYVILLLYLNSVDLYQAENQVFKPTSLFVILHCGVGKNWAGPFFPPSKMLDSFYLSSRLLDYVILLLYLNSLDLHQAENQVFKQQVYS